MGETTWPQMNADQCRFKTNTVSAFIGVYRRPGIGFQQTLRKQDQEIEAYADY
jgi:hypothetical protein